MGLRYVMKAVKYCPKLMQIDKQKQLYLRLVSRQTAKYTTTTYILQFIFLSILHRSIHSLPVSKGW